jgi:hypothetical protein
MQWHDYFGRTLERFDRRWRARNCEDTHRDTILPGWVTKNPHTLDAPDSTRAAIARSAGWTGVAAPSALYCPEQSQGFQADTCGHGHARHRRAREPTPLVHW